MKINREYIEQYIGYQERIDYDIDLERVVLGIITLEPTAYGTVYGILTEDCFYNADHKRVFAMIEELYQSGAPIDLLTIARKFCDNGVLELGGMAIGGFLAGLSMDVCSSAHLEYWAIILRDLAARRVMIEITRSGMIDDNVFATVENINEQIRRVMDIKTTDDWFDAIKAGKKFLDKRSEMEAARGAMCITTTIPSLDRLNGGFKGKQFVILAARPAVGKSAFAGKIAIGNAMHGHPVGFITLEMGIEDIFGRMVAADSAVHFNELDRDIMMGEKEHNAMMASVSKLSTLPIYFSEKTEVNIYDIRAKAEKLKRKYGIKILIIDYLQLIEETHRNNRNREQVISEISRGLKKIAMNLNMTVIALSQLNREVEKRMIKIPMLADLRESGSLEQDADIVMLLHRPWVMGEQIDEFGNSTERKASLLVPKWRNGIPTTVDLCFDPPLMKFYEEVHGDMPDYNMTYF